MSLKSKFTKCLTFLFGKHNPVDQERSALYSLGSIRCDAGALTTVGEINLADILSSPETMVVWNETQTKLGSFNIVDGTGGARSRPGRPPGDLLPDPPFAAGLCA